MTAPDPHALKALFLPVHVIVDHDGFTAYLCQYGQIKSRICFYGSDGKERALDVARAVNNFDAMRSALEAVAAHSALGQSLRDLVEIALKNSEEKRRA